LLSFTVLIVNLLFFFSVLKAEGLYLLHQCLAASTW